MAMRLYRTLAIGAFAAGLALLAVVVADPLGAQPVARGPAHAQILDLHANATHAPASTHQLKGQMHEIRHVDNQVVSGARVGRALPPGHYPLAKVVTPGGTSKVIGAGEHHLSVKHDGGRWRVYAADPKGRVHEAGHVQVSAVRAGKLPGHTLRAGSLLFWINFPVGFDPFGNPLYVTVGFMFP
jgi:hypothetical protein